MRGRLRLRRQPGGFLAKFTDARVVGKGKSMKRGHGCRICVNEVLFDNLYEFARARELLGTTDISYGDFIKQYIWPVFGHAMAPRKAIYNCLDEHIRPGLRREAFIYELEQDQREGRLVSERDIDDFCLGRPPRKELLERLAVDHTSPVDDAPLTSPEAEIEIMAEIERTLYDPSLDDGVTRHKLVYWREALTNDSQRAKNND